MTDLAKLVVTLEAQTAKYQKELSNANRKLDKFARENEKSTQRVAAAFRGLQGVIAGVVTVESVRRIASIADNYSTLQTRIRAATAETNDYASVSARLFSISQDTATSLDQNVRLFDRLRVGAQELGRSNADVLKLTESINKLGAIGGSSQTEIANASTQLSQALAGGIVRAEEFNSIVENTPRLAVAIADGLGVSVGQLRKMVLDGRLLSDDVFTAILSQTKEIDKQFAATGTNLTRAFERAQGILQTFIGQLNESAGITRRIAGWIDDWAKSMAVVVNEMNRSEIYDQAEKVNASRAELSRLNSELDDLKKRLELAPGNTFIQREITRLDTLISKTKTQLELEQKRFDLLSGRDILTNSAQERLGLPPDPNQNPAPPSSGAANGAPAGPKPIDKSIIDYDALMGDMDIGLVAYENYTNSITEMESQLTETLAREEEQRQRLRELYSQQAIASASGLFAQITSLIGQAAGEDSAAYKAAFAMQQGMLAAQTIMNAEASATAALAPPPIGLGPVAGAGYAQTLRALGYASAGIIAGQGFAGLFDNGGHIPSGQFGIAGERGPEIVNGPAHVTSRLKTAEMMGGGQPNIKIINAVDPSLMLEALGSAAGEKVIMNTVKRNQAALRGR